VVVNIIISTFRRLRPAWAKKRRVSKKAKTKTELECENYILVLHP
jgi:hypothetical protein